MAVQQQYQLVFSGQALSDRDIDTAKEAFAKFFRIQREHVDNYFNGQARVVKRGLDAETAHRYVEVLRRNGIDSHLEEITLSFDEEQNSEMSQAPNDAPNVEPSSPEEHDASVRNATFVSLLSSRFITIVTWTILAALVLVRVGLAIIDYYEQPVLEEFYAEQAKALCKGEAGCTSAVSQQKERCYYTTLNNFSPIEKDRLFEKHRIQFEKTYFECFKDANGQSLFFYR